MPNDPVELSTADVRHVARLARLALSDEQVEHFRTQLAAVLAYVRRLHELDLDGVEPLTHVGDVTNRLDDDEPGPSLATEALLDMAPGSLPPFVKVPRVLGEGPAA